MASARRQTALRTLALVVLVCVTFGRVATHEFVNIDDDTFISANEKYLPPTLTSVEEIWGQAHARLYVPVTMSVWWGVAQAGLIRDAAQPGSPYALNPWFFHGASLLVHLVNVLLVRRLLRSITEDDVTAVVGAAVFAVHPLQVETVAWASELKDLLAAMFSLLAITSAVAATSREGGQRRWPWWCGAAMYFALALLSKPSAVSLPVAAAAVLWLMRAKPRAIVRMAVVGFVMAAPLILATRAAQPTLELSWTPLWQRPLIAADAIAFYLGKLIWPAHVAIDYGRTPSAVIASGAAYWTWIVPVAVTTVVLLSRRPGLIAAWLIFLAGPAANLGLLPFDFQNFSSVADHYVYFGLFGVALAVAWVVREKPKAVWGFVPILVVLTALTFAQAGRWRDSFSLWRHAMTFNPDSTLAHINLGAAYLADRKPAEAIPFLERAAKLKPGEPWVHLNLVYAHLALGDTTRAATAAEALAAATGRYQNVDRTLVAAVLDRVAQLVAARGDESSAKRLRDGAARVRGN